MMQDPHDDEPPSQFYSGLVAELYDPLAGETSRAEDYAPFLERSGTPALELACGSGRPLIELLEQGYEVDGLDASSDMLDLCRARAAERALGPVLYLAEMQSFEIPRRYRSIFLAGASFTLLTTDRDALAALERIREHLEPGGSALIPLAIEDVDAIRSELGRVRESVDPAGNRLRFATLSVDVEADGRTVAQRLRYERISATGERTIIERTWKKRWWTREQFRELVEAAGFERLAFRSPGGGPADPGALVFVALAQRSG